MFEVEDIARGTKEFMSQEEGEARYGWVEFRVMQAGHKLRYVVRPVKYGSLNGLI
jgi:hypothetical protein